MARHGVKPRVVLTGVGLQGCDLKWTEAEK